MRLTACACSHPKQLTEKTRKNLEVSSAFSACQLGGYEFQERKLPLAQGAGRTLLVLLEKRCIGTEFLDDDERVDSLVLIEIDQVRNATEQLPEMLIFRLDEAHVAEASFLERLEDSLLRNTVEGDSRAAGNSRAALLHHLAKRVLVIGAIARQGDGDEIVLLVVPDEIQNEREFLAVALAQTAPELLNEDDG